MENEINKTSHLTSLTMLILEKNTATSPSSQGQYFPSLEWAQHLAIPMWTKLNVQ